MSRQVKLYLLAGSLAIIAGAFFFRSAEYGNQTEGRNPASSFSSAIRGGESFLYNPTAGEQYVYRFTRAISFQGLNNSIPEIKYQGELSFDVFHSDQSGFDAIVRDSITGQSLADPISIRIHMASDGSKLDLYSDKNASPAARERINIMKDLVANWAFPIQADTVGLYSASFSSLPTKDGFLQKMKRKISYSGSRTAPEIAQSQHVMAWDMSLSFPHSLSGTEQLILGKTSSGIKTKSIYNIEFDHRAKGFGVSKAELAGLRNKSNLQLIANVNGDEHPDLAGISLEKVLADLRRIHTLTKSDQLKTFGDLSHLLRSDRESLPQVLALLGPDILAQGTNSPLFNTIVGSLATVATAETQAALINLYQDSSASILAKGGILTALTTTQASLDDATRAFLDQTMKSEANPDLAQAAGFALGASLQNSSSSATVAQAIDHIQNAWTSLQSGPNISIELALLDTMGNSGRPEFFSDISSVISSSTDSILRAKAVFSLRYYTASAAISILSNSLQDSDPRVRTAAVQAMQIAPWNEGFRGALQKCSANEQLSSVQNACSSVLTQAATHVSSL